MSALARFLARITWWYCLWFMRRPWIKAMRRWSLYLIPPRRRERTFRQFVRQNNFAQRHAIRILTIVYNLFLMYVIVAFVYWSTMMLFAGGYLTMPSQR